METKFGTVDHPVYGTLEFPLAEGAKGITLAQADEWLKANPDFTSQLKIKNHAAATKDSLDELSKNLGPVDRAQLYLYNFFDQNGANIAKNFGKMGAEATLSTVGQAVGAMTGPFAGAAIPALGAAGAFAGNAGAQFVNDGKVNWGDALGAGATGAVPGGSLAKLTTGQLAWLGAKQSLAAVAADTVRKKVDEKRTITPPEAISAAVFGYASPYIGKGLDRASNAPTMAAAERELHDAFKQESDALGRELGFVRIPTSVDPKNQMYQKLESAAGIIDVMKDATRINRPKVNEAVRNQFNIKGPLNPSTLPAHVEAAMMPYKEIADLSDSLPRRLAYPFQAVPPGKSETELVPSIGETLLEWRKSNQAAKDNWRSYYFNNGGPDAQKAAEAADKSAEFALNAIDDELKRAGKLDLLNRLTESRVKLAQLGVVEMAMNPGTGDINPEVLGDLLQKGYKLTGNLNKIARFQKANERAMKDASNVSAPGVSRLGAALQNAAIVGGAVAGGAIGKGDPASMGAGGMAGALGAAAIAKGIGAIMPQPGTIPRAVMFSDMFQNRLVKPNYGSTIQDPAAAMARYMTARQGQEEPVQAQLSQYISR